MGRNTTGPPWSVGRPTARRQPARPPALLQTTTDASEQNNTGLLGGPVVIVTRLWITNSIYLAHFSYLFRSGGYCGYKCWWCFVVIVAETQLLIWHTLTLLQTWATGRCFTTVSLLVWRFPTCHRLCLLYLLNFSKIPRLQLWVKVGHRLLNLCDCDSVLSERCRQSYSQDVKKIIIPYSYKVI